MIFLERAGQVLQVDQLRRFLVLIAFFGGDYIGLIFAVKTGDAGKGAGNLVGHFNRQGSGCGFGTQGRKKPGLDEETQ